MIRTRTFSALTALVFALVVGAAAAQGNPLAPVASSGFEVTFEGSDPAGVLDGILTIGTDGPWTGTLTGSSYELRNMTDVGAVRYHYLLEAPGVDPPLTQGTVTVDVVVKTDPQDDVSGAGLIFDFRERTGDYFAFVVTAGGYALYRRDGEGFRLLTADASDAVAADGLRRLAVRAVDNQVELFVDRAFVLQIESDGVPSGGVGIVALGVGTFTYDAFALERP